MIKMINKTISFLKSNFKQDSYIPIYRIVEIQQNENEDFSVIIQLIGKSTTFRMKPEEILANDKLVNCFIPIDIRTLTYLGYLKINSPSYKILAQRFAQDNKVLFILKKKDSNNVIVKSAEEIILEEEILSKISKEDTTTISYTLNKLNQLSKKAITGNQSMEDLDKQHRIVIFGDSNTWGYKYNSFDNLSGKCDRYDKNIRWSGLLQMRFPNTHIIESGLNGRTISVKDKEYPGRSGLKYLPIILEENAPVNILIISLGTNDLKAKYKRDANIIAQDMKDLIITARKTCPLNDCPSTQIIITSPIKIANEESFGADFLGATKLNNELPSIYKKLAEEFGVIFVDLNQVNPSIDGIHLDVTGHKEVAKILIPIIEKLL